MIDLHEMVVTLLSTLHDWVTDFVTMLPNLFMATLLLIVGHLGGRWAQRALQHFLERVTGNKPISRLLATLGRVAVVSVSVFVVLGLLHLDKTVTSLLAGVGVVGLALGFAFQDIAANFMAGILMALNRPFDLDDYVEVNGHRGTVSDIHIRATALQTLDGLSILIPNKDVYQNAIINFTRTPHRRVEVAVGTAYGDDMLLVRRTVIGALDDVPHREKSQPAEVLFDSFGDSSINFSVLLWLERSDELSVRRARSAAMVVIKAALDREGLTIPFPIRTLDFGARVVGGQSLEDARIKWTRSAAE